MAKATLTTQSDKGLGPGSPPDAQALMGDFGVDCDTVTWMLELDGLLDGLYRVWVYARSTAGVSTGDVTVFQGAALAELPGSTGAQLQPGVSVALGDALVTKGTLQIEGQGTGAFACVGIAGVQLERQLAPPAGVPVPALSSGSLALLVLGLLGAGGCALGRWGVRAT